MHEAQAFILAHFTTLPYHKALTHCLVAAHMVLLKKWEAVHWYEEKPKAAVHVFCFYKVEMTKKRQIICTHNRKFIGKSAPMKSTIMSYASLLHSLTHGSRVFKDNDSQSISCSVVSVMDVILAACNDFAHLLD